MHQKIKLISKRNQVYRAIEDEKSYISKSFMNIEDMKKEIEILKLLENTGVRVPMILEIRGQILLLEDLGDETLLDWYENQEKENLYGNKDKMMKIIQWMKAFYFATKQHYKQQIILSDVNFRNFMIKDNEIFGIDFEGVRLGEIKEDIGKLLAYGLTYNPAATNWKLDFSREFAELLAQEFFIEKAMIIEAQNRELEDIENRRKGK